MSFTVPVNRTEMLSLAGVGLLYQALELRSGSKLIRETQKLVASIADLLAEGAKPARATLIKMSCSLIGQDAAMPSPNSRVSAPGPMSPPSSKASAGKTSPRHQLSAIAARFSFSGPRHHKKNLQGGNRRGTTSGTASGAAATTAAAAGRSAQNTSPLLLEAATYVQPDDNNSARLTSERIFKRGPDDKHQHRIPSPSTSLANLDFFPIGADPALSGDASSASIGGGLQQPIKAESPRTNVSANRADSLSSDWDKFIDPFPSFEYSLTSATASGPYDLAEEFLLSPDFVQTSPPCSTVSQSFTGEYVMEESPTGLDWSPPSRTLINASAASSASSSDPLSATTHSLLSLSDESLTSAEGDLSCADLDGGLPGFVMSGDHANYCALDDFGFAEFDTGLEFPAVGLESLKVEG